MDHLFVGIQTVKAQVVLLIVPDKYHHPVAGAVLFDLI
jgi:hypothetical protein